jgi:hypothetical protein
MLFLAFFLIWKGCGSVVVVLGRDADHMYPPPPLAVNTNNKLQQRFIDVLCCYSGIFGLFGWLWDVRARCVDRAQDEAIETNHHGKVYFGRGIARFNIAIYTVYF